ncbi:MAG: twin transmembrane helix small protein [Pseudomonadota bacterium]
MSTFLALLLIATMIAVVAVLVRGVVIFLKNAGDDVRNGEGPSAASLQSNKMMTYRVILQGFALMLVVVLLLLYGKH